MPIYTVKAPNGRTYEMEGPKGWSEDDAIAHVMRYDPTAGTEPPKPKTGLGASFQSGLENLGSSVKAGVKGLYDPEGAAADAAAAAAEQAQKYDSQISLKRLGEVYDKDGIFAAGKEMVGQGLRGIAQSAPQMGVTMAGAAAGARAGSMFGAPGAIVGGIGGGILAGLPAFTGQNLAGQQEAAQAAIAKGEAPAAISYGKALAAGAGQAALEEVAPLALMGTRIASKVFGKDMASLITKLGPEAAEEVAKRRLSATLARGGGVGALGEAGTEVLQDALGRMQAGQSLLDEEAMKSYAESAYGGALPGGMLGAAGHAYDRSGAKTEVEGRRQAAEALAEQHLASEQEAKAAAAAQADEQRRAATGYADDIAKQNAAYEQQKKAMEAEIVALKNEGTDAGTQAAIALNQKLKDFKEQSQPLLDEFNATREVRKARDAEEAAAAEARGEPPTPAGMLFGGYDDAKKQERVTELQRQIAEHEEMLPLAEQQAREIGGTGRSNEIAQANAGLAQRQKEYAAAQKELFSLAPELQKQRVVDEEADLLNAQARTLNPIQAQRQIAALLEKQKLAAGNNELKKAGKFAADRERLEKLLEMHGQLTAAPEASPYAEDLFQLDDRMQRQQDVMGRRQARTSASFDADLVAEDAALGKDLTASAALDTPTRRKQDTADALGRVFGTEQRSGMLDVLGATPETGVIQPRENTAMEQVAAEGKQYGERPAPAPTGRVVAGKGPTLPNESRGTVTLEDAQGQGMLFTPQGAPSTTPAELLRQRIGTLLAMPRLEAPAKATLQRAADLLDAPDVPVRVLEHIRNTVAQAEKGAGRRIDVREGDKVVDDAGRLRLQTRRDVTPASEEREVQGTGVLVGDEGELFPGSPTAKVRTAGRGERPLAVRPLEMEEVGSAGPNADEQGDLFHKMYAGRATPANFQRALDTGALPSKRTSDEARKAHQGMRTAAAILRVKAKGLKLRLAAAAAATKRLAGMDQDFATMPDAQRDALKTTLHNEKMDATKAAQQARATAERYKALAESGKFLTDDADIERQHEYAGRAAQAEQEVLKHEQRIKDYDDTLNAVISTNAAPYSHKMAVRHEALTKELAQVEKDTVEVGKEMNKRRRKFQRKVQERRGHRATAASAKTGLGGMPTDTLFEEATAYMQAGAEAQAAAAAEKKAAAQAERKAAAAKIAAERVQAQEAAEKENAEYLRKRKEAAEIGALPYQERTQRDVTQHRMQPREATVGEVHDAIEDAVSTALSIPGVTKEALRKVFQRVRKYTQHGSDTRASTVGTELSKLHDDMNRFRAQNPGGMLPPKHRKSYQQAILEKGHRDEQLKAAESAAARTPLMNRMAVLDKHINWLNEQRTPWANDAQYQAMRTQAAMLQFQTSLIDFHRDALAAGDVLPEAPVSVKPAPEKGMVHVEPTAKLITDEVNELTGLDEPRTRMSIAEELGAKSKYGFKGKNAPPLGPQTNENVKPVSAMDSLKAMQEIAAKRLAEAAQPGIDMEAEGGRTIPKLLSDAYEAISATPLSRQNMEHAHDGQLDKVLASLAKTGSTPAVRELAAKLQALTKNTKLVVEADADTRVAASYSPKADSISIHPLALTEENLLHEAVHAATLRTLALPDSQLTREQRNARNELNRLFAQLQKDPAFAKEYALEDVGELASEVMTNQGLRDKIAAKQPGIIRRFVNAVLQLLGVQHKPADARAMAAVEKLFMPAKAFTRDERMMLAHTMGYFDKAAPSAARAATPALDRFSRSVTAAPREKGIAGAKAFIKDHNAGLSAEFALVDQRAPLMKALSAGTKHAFMQAQYYIRKADARMAQVGASLLNGTLQLKKDAKGNHIVEATGKTSGKDVFMAIKDLPGATPEAKFALAQSYMVAQRAGRVGWDKLGWDTTDQFQREGEAALAEANANPALKAKLDNVRKVYNDYNSGMIQFLSDTGALPKAKAQELLRDGDYVPFYRVSPSGVAELVMGESAHIRVGDITRQPYLKELKGDDTKLLPLSEAIMRNTMLLTDMGLKNLATKSVAYSMQDMGKEKGPKDKNGKATNLNVIHSVHKSGEVPSGPDIIKFRQEPDPNDAADKGERWMRVTSRGTAFEGIPAEMLVQSMEGSHAVLTGMGKLAGVFSNALRSGVTRTPAYLLRQLTRDPMSASFTAGIDRGPLAATIQSMREFVSQSRGKSATGDTLLRKAVTQSGIFNGTAEDMNKIALQLAGGDQAAYKKLFAALDRAAMRADSATRAQVYEDTLKKTGSEMEAELAAIEMMNFTKRGNSPTVQYATRVIPFMNAQIQALNVLAKAARGNATMEEKLKIKEKFFKNAMGLAAFTLLYSAGMEDDPDYKAASAQERMNNFFVPNPFGPAWKIPIPYEVGFFFKALPEMVLRGIEGKTGPKDWEALRGGLLNMVPGASSMGMPQMIAPAVQAAFNRNAFGNPIESVQQQKLAKTERFNEGTTELAKGMSNLMAAILPEFAQLSSLKIEHLVRGYLGSMPIAIEALVEDLVSAGGKDKPSRMASQNPVYGAFVAKDVGTGPKEAAYAELDNIEQVEQTLAHLREEGDAVKAQEYAQENVAALTAKGAAATIKQQMASIRDWRKGVLENKQLTGPQKREEINKLDTLAATLSERFVTNVRAMREARAQ